MNSTQIIEALGGVAETARLCDISMAAVSQWHENGIPKTQLKFLMLARPEIFNETDKADKRHISDRRASRRAKVIK